MTIFQHLYRWIRYIPNPITERFRPQMNPQHLIAIRVDFLLSEYTDDFINEISDWFDSKPHTSMTSTSVRGKKKRDVTYYTDSPSDLSPILCDFESYAVRIIETSDAVTEIISVAPISDEKLSKILSDDDFGTPFLGSFDWASALDIIRRHFPTDKQGPESTILWVSPDSLELGDISHQSVTKFFSSQTGRNFLSDFNKSTGYGSVLLDKSTLIFPGDISYLPGNILAVDLSEKVSTAISTGPYLNVNELSPISFLLGVHYWCEARGRQIDAIEERISDSYESLPSRQNNPSADEYLELDQEIYDVQEEWGEARSKIVSERLSLQGRLEHFSPEIEETSESSGDSKQNRAQEKIFTSYISGLEAELTGVASDVKRIDSSIQSLTSYYDNQVSVMVAKENVNLQRNVEKQNTQSILLNRHVAFLTRVVTILTIVLVFDALMSGGLAKLVDNLLKSGISGISSQVYAGIILCLLFLAPLAVYHFQNEDSESDD